MALVINTNVASLVAQRRLTIHTLQVDKAMERLSSGNRINRAADDAAGLTISQHLISQIRRMQQAADNTQDGLNILSVVEGTLSVMTENLQRIRELTVQAANDTYDVNSRNAVKAEIQSLLSDIDRMAVAAQFNGIQLLDGTTTNAFLQVGPNSDPTANRVDMTSALGTATATGLGVLGGGATFSSIASVMLSDNAQALTFLADLDNALNQVSIRRSLVGSYQKRLESVASNLTVNIENLSRSNSQIRDTDVAAEASKLAQAQVLQNAATTILGQTNRLPQMILGLLQQ